MYFPGTFTTCFFFNYTGDTLSDTETRFEQSLQKHLCMAPVHTFARYHVTTAAVCSFLCRSQSRCTSFNFYVKTVTMVTNCELNDGHFVAGPNLSDFVVNENCFYYKQN